jgi:nitronate monooxygenase
MAGGVSTVELAAAACNAGGLGFLAAGYLTVDTVGAQVADLRSRTDAPFGVNVFAAREASVDQQALDDYVASLEPVAERFGTLVGAPTFDDDHLEAKLAMLVKARVPLVSFTFGCPSRDMVRSLQSVGSQVWVTVATPGDAAVAAQSGCDALVVQGVEAGGHRAAFEDDLGEGALETVTLVRRVAGLTRLPLVAAGGIADRSHVRRVLDAGAAAVQVGTAFLLTPEAGTSAVHRSMVGADRQTSLTRAFSGRTARGIENDFMREHADAPVAYPQIHHATSPIRSAARAAGDPEFVNLWAGTRHAEARAVPAADVVRALLG